MRPGKFWNVALARVTRITAFSSLAEYEVVIRRTPCHPLPTPATAVLFMIAFFVVMVGVPLLILRWTITGHYTLWARTEHTS